MKNLRILIYALTLLLGVTVEGFGQCSQNIGIQLGIVFLQAKGFDPSLLITLTILVLIILVLYRIFSKKEEKNELRSSTTEEERQFQHVRIPSVGDWLGRFLTVMIPVLGLIALIVWAVDDKDKIRKNWAIAFIIFTIVLMVFSYFLGGLIVSDFMERMRR